MHPKTRVQHGPHECKEALVRTCAPIVLDLETTGLKRWDQIVSAGLLVDGVAHILFAHTEHSSITNLKLADFQAALAPLTRPDLVVIGHNLQFDLGFLSRMGIKVQGECRDTLKILRLLDQDRIGAEGMDKKKRSARRDLLAPFDMPLTLDYKLKHVASQLLRIKMLHFPGAIAFVPYDVHARYLACDLVGTKRLYDFLWAKLSPGERSYYEQLVAPLIPILLDMTELGVQAHQKLVRVTCQRLYRLFARMSLEHRDQFGVPLGMDNKQLIAWLFGKLGLPILKYAGRGKGRVPSLDGEALRRLLVYADDDPKATASIKLIQDYRKTASLLVRLRSLLPHIAHTSGRIHSSFNDRQSSGRISSSVPNLQQLAKEKKIRGKIIRCRNALRASEGFELVAFDIAQADIRVLANAVENCPWVTRSYQEVLWQERLQNLSDEARQLLAGLRDCRNLAFVAEESDHPEFSPQMPPDLAQDFRTEGDFYCLATGRFLGEKIGKDDPRRARYKTLILSIVNGKGPPSLAKDLKCSQEEAKGYLEAFDRAYPKVAAYKWLMYWQIACTGQTSTFMGRVRTVTAHRWLVTQPRVKILVSYRHGDVYWVEVVPLIPSLRVLTSYVLRVWNAKSGRLIYDHQRGRLSRKPYRVFEVDELQYLLPYRNWAWRSIRRVRTGSEEAEYEGFDATARSAFNFICQGGTADVSKIMMLRCQPVCRDFDARLLIQIHDELVFEVPRQRTDEFIGTMQKVLEVPPVPNFAVPVVVEPKRGFWFGRMRKVKTT